METKTFEVKSELWNKIYNSRDENTSGKSSKIYFFRFSRNLISDFSSFRGYIYIKFNDYSLSGINLYNVFKEDKIFSKYQKEIFKEFSESLWEEFKAKYFKIVNKSKKFKSEKFKYENFIISYPFRKRSDLKVDLQYSPISNLPYVSELKEGLNSFINLLYSFYVGHEDLKNATVGFFNVFPKLFKQIFKSTSAMIPSQYKDLREKVAEIGNVGFNNFGNIGDSLGKYLDELKNKSKSVIESIGEFKTYTRLRLTSSFHINFEIQFNIDLLSENPFDYFFLRYILGFCMFPKHTSINFSSIFGNELRNLRAFSSFNDPSQKYKITTFIPIFLFLDDVVMTSINFKPSDQTVVRNINIGKKLYEVVLPMNVEVSIGFSTRYACDVIDMIKMFSTHLARLKLEREEWK